VKGGPATAGVGLAAQRKIRAVEDALAHYSLDGDNVLASLEALQELVGTDKVLLYSLAERPGSDDLMVARNAGVAFSSERWKKVLEGYIRGRGVSWGVYNAIHPEPAQRDRVLRSAELAVLTKRRSVAVEQGIQRRLGTLGDDTMRVLVCDGPSMLAWLGFSQSEQTTERQRTLLELVLPAYRRRLQFERFVSEAALASGAVEAALEQVAGAAWVLGSAGRIAHVNSVGRARFDRDRDGTRAALEAVAAGEKRAHFHVTPLRSSEGRCGHLVVELADPNAARNALPDIAVRFGLTPAQTRVFERIVVGTSNAATAADLGVAERTVEAHVTAILEKAQVSSRAALIVQIFRDHRGV